MERRTDAREDQRTAEFVAALFAQFMAELQAATGADERTILSGAHAAVLARLVMTFGRQHAQGIVEDAANRIATAPSDSDLRLFNATPAGRA